MDLVSNFGVPPNFVRWSVTCSSQMLVTHMLVTVQQAKQLFHMTKLMTEGQVTYLHGCTHQYPLPLPLDYYPLPLPTDYGRTGYRSLPTVTPNWLRKDMLHITTHCYSQLVMEGQVTYHYPLSLPIDQGRTGYRCQSQILPP